MLSVDELSRLSGMDLMTVRSELFDLELDGWVQAQSGRLLQLVLKAMNKKEPVGVIT